MINSEKIKLRMAELKLTQKDIAIAIKKSNSVTNQKINNIRPMRLTEADVISELLKLSDKEFKEFFLVDSCKMQHDKNE